MTVDPFSRRNFLGAVSAGVGGAWLATHWTSVLSAATDAAAAVAAPGTPRFRALTPSQSAEIEAMAARIIPSDDGPGAREAGAVYFIDRVLQTFAREALPLVTTGVTALAAATRARYPSAGAFSTLEPAGQDEVLRAIEQTDFFRFVRWGTIAGFLANPSYGGNRDGAGWKWIGFEDRFVWQPPFGHYDRGDAGGT